ncbi:hypothetical protein [Halogeometricum sp. CBA1124]|uniref:hypothetical protein n=1 Tax=Halogeometricum sp. CBA1124 TaxID=2668071 RepID=UPI001428E507|nr:hypothetical protein [Halogeometricum sp. CBA1124]MUV56288.1 hypothetical protein [Halogeometricum sp. CBA1124]
MVAAHDFVDDRLTVEQLFETDVPYVGLTGPRDRFEEMLRLRLGGADVLRRRPRPPLHAGRTGPRRRVDAAGRPARRLGVPAVENERTPQHLRSRAGTIRDRVEVRSDGGR